MIDWPAIGTVFRVGHGLWNAVTRQIWPGAIRVTSFTMAGEPERRRWAGRVVLFNAGTEHVNIPSLRLTGPSGGSLRYDPPIMLWTLGEDTSPKRERGLGAAAIVMNIDQDISGGEYIQFSFVFVPPSDWLGGVFTADLQYRVQGAQEWSRTIKLSKRLSQESR